MSIIISRAEGARDMERVRTLFLDYLDWLQVDLCFQGFDEEVRTIPGRYAPPTGCLLLARDGDEVAGGVGMWALDEDGVSEMKRLFVYERWRGHGLGRRLAEAIMAEAVGAGCSFMRLDTLDFMTGARAFSAPWVLRNARLTTATPWATFSIWKRTWP